MGLHVKEDGLIFGGRSPVADWPQGLVKMMMLCDAEEKWVG